MLQVLGEVVWLDIPSNTNIILFLLYKTVEIYELRESNIYYEMAGVKFIYASLK